MEKKKKGKNKGKKKKDPLEEGMTPLVAHMVKCLPEIPETQVQSLGWEDLLEKEMAMNTSILAWKIPWMNEPGGLKSMGSEEGMATYANIIAWRIPWTEEPGMLQSIGLQRVCHV